MITRNQPPKRSRKLQGSTAGPELRAVIHEMSALVQVMLADALRAYQISDVKLARRCPRA